MTATTDLKPGDVVQHPEKGHGIVRRRFARNDVGVVYADKDREGIDSYTTDLTGWENVEIVKPGHVQVRVDDLDLNTAAGRMSAATRLYMAFTPPQPDEPTGIGAVVKVGGKRFVRTDEDGHPWIDNVAYWHTWDEITDRGPVTVLSEGVQS